MRRSIKRALRTANNFLDLLEEMVRAYKPAERPDMRWIYKDQQTLKDWIAILERAEFAEDVNAIWHQVENIALILDCAIDDDLGRRYRRLAGDFFREMTEVVAEARRRHSRRGMHSSFSPRGWRSGRSREIR